MKNQFDEQIHIKLMTVTSLLKSHEKSICTAESCTGGLLSMYLTELSGSSNWFECGFITYSNEAKTALLAVDPMLIKEHGAVSEEVAQAMAHGALDHCSADIAVSITGIAGPTGGTSDKPVGTVCFAVATQNKFISEVKYFDSQDRQSIRAQSCLFALSMIERFIT